MYATDASPAAGDSSLTVIGESLVDIISDRRGPAGIEAHPGGSPLNVAVGAARLDLRTNPSALPHGSGSNRCARR